jgi:hypothetical protein
MAEAPFINISKLDAAKRQLETAILLFFKSQDVVSIHTLAYAAHRVLTDLGSQQGKKSLLWDDFIQMTVPARRNEVYEMLSGAANFFKHANRDGAGVYKFYLRQTEFVLWDACRMYHVMANDIPPALGAYNLWFQLSHTPIIDDENAKRLLNGIRLNLDPNNKASFLEVIALIQGR